jgi:hypothetical protein
VIVSDCKTPFQKAQRTAFLELQAESVKVLTLQPNPLLDSQVELACAFLQVHTQRKYSRTKIERNNPCFRNCETPSGKLQTPAQATRELCG